jgi:hypothetical protein
VDVHGGHDEQILDLVGVCVNRIGKVEPSVMLDSALSRFSAIGKRLPELIASYGQDVPEFEPTALTFSCDASKVKDIKPSMFTFERRAEEPFETGLYFSTAPLRTTDHIQLLNELESVFVV